MSRVIIVDDQQLNRKILSKLAGTLEPGVHVEAFADPLEALSYADEHTPDLLITDFKMPIIDGAELIRRFRQISACKAVPVIVVTAYEDVQFRLLALKAGANDFVLSPVDHEEFCAQSRRLLELHRSDKYIVPGIGDFRGEQRSAGSSASLSQIEMYNGLVENLTDQLLTKTKELSRLSTEMQSLIDVSETAAIFVDEGLLVRRFTSAAAGLYSLGEQDIGTSLAEVECDLDYPELTSDFSQVMLTGESSRRWLKHRNGNLHYLVRIVPTQRGRGRPAGATLIFSAPFLRDESGTLH
jgi:CheY-like chemotaxis protein